MFAFVGAFVASGNDSGSGGKTHNGSIFVSVVVPDMLVVKRTPEHKAFWKRPNAFAERARQLDETCCDSADLVAKRALACE
jgi:hypothetical protein